MRKILLAAAVALPFTFLGINSAKAGCCSPPPPTSRIGISIGICWRTWAGNDCGPKGPGCCAQPPSCCGCSPVGCGYGPVPAGPGAMSPVPAGPGAMGPVAAGPGYNYYPYQAQFQTPAPTGYANWPGPTNRGPSPMFGGNYYQNPNVNQGFSNYPAAPIQPCGYYPAPSYWYGQ
jgi:hypothetical protein